MQDFLYMGGYYAFVWPAYGLVLVVLILNLTIPRRRERRILRRVARQGGEGRRRG